MGIFKHRAIEFAAIGIGLILVVTAATFEPLTRTLVAVDDVCTYCHVEQEYRSDVRLAYSKDHPLPPTQAEPATPVTENEAEAKQQAACAQCHLPPGLINTLYAYSHFASLTDLFGHFRDRNAERDGAWLPPRQVAAFRVRDRLYEYNSSTCRSCHIETDIEPKRERGKNAHQKALNEQMTCIECHYNEKHRSVDLRQNAFAQAAAK